MQISPDHLLELEAFEAKYRAAPTGQIVFFGSSSMRMWPGLSRAFPGVFIENWGFGGSTLRECADAFGRFIVPRALSGLVLYAGDNDLANGATPEAVWEALRDFMDARDAHLSAVQTAFLSLKISASRLSLRAEIESANRWCQREIWARQNAQWVDIVPPMLDETGTPRAELFMPDELHLSRAGYDLWNEVLRREVDWLN